MNNSHPRKEGRFAKMIEDQTSKVPSDAYLWAAVGSMAASLALFVSGKKHTSLFIGQWAPSLLIMGIYNKIVKVAGNDEQDRENSTVTRQATASV
jgi:hypothetical protein